MAILFVDENTVTSGPVFSDPFLNDFDWIIIGRNITAISTDGPAIFSTDLSLLTITVEGSLYGGDSAIELIALSTVSAGFQSDYVVSVTETGVIGAVRRAVHLAFDNEDSHHRSQVRNDGLIESNTSSAIYLESGDEGVVLNTGIIRNSVSLQGLQVPVANTIIISTTYGRIENSGSILGETYQNAVPPISQGFAGEDALILSTIEGGSAGKQAGDAFEVFNTGLIGGLVSIVSEQGVDNIINSGEILGQIWTGSFNDRVENTGKLSGDVMLGADDDVFDGFGGLATGEIHGGDGDDIIRSGYGDDWIDGGAGADLINGGLGVDTLSYASASSGVELTLGLSIGYGTLGDAQGDTILNIENLVGSNYNDRLRGSGADNVINGGSGADNLRGFNGDDRLFGGDGADTVFGDSGDDVLVGGAGADVLVGGNGRDRFIFSDGDTGRGSNADTIFDFNRTEDLVDLSAIDAIDATAEDDAFTLLELGAEFSGAGGEARWVVQGDDVFLQLEMTGDTTPDAAIIFKGGFPSVLVGYVPGTYTEIREDLPYGEDIFIL